MNLGPLRSSASRRHNLPGRRGGRGQRGERAARTRRRGRRAIHRAGPGLAEEAVPLGPIGPGEAVITGAHGLPNRYVVHTLGPVYGQDRPEAELLAGCYRNSLALAEENGIESIASPPSRPVSSATRSRKQRRWRSERCETKRERLERVHLVRFVLFGESDSKSTIGSSPN